MTELRAACYRRDVGRDGWPDVAVVMPIRNEAPHLADAVASVLEQDYPTPVTVCLAVAPSDDDTDDVARRLAEADERITVTTNPKALTSAGLNAAISATSGDVVVRVDGHAMLSPGYIRRAVETMIRTGAVNVGGRQVPKPTTEFEHDVAATTSSWLGTGGATYRIGGDAGPVDTVYLGVFDRAAGDSLGWFDESLVRNQDYEFNIRLRDAGGVVWFDPALRVDYRPRGSWAALARQYYEYGFWKAEVARRHPRSLRLRQAVPAALPVVLVAAVGLRSARWLAAAYVAVLATSGTPRRAAVAATTHVSWGLGWWSAVAGLVRRRPS